MMAKSIVPEKLSTDRNELDHEIAILERTIKNERRILDKTKDQLSILARAQFELELAKTENKLLNLMIERLKL